MGISRSAAIRAIARKSDPGQRNKWFIEQVKKEFNLDIRASQVVEVLGPWKERRGKGRLFEAKLELAREYVAKMDSLNDAARFVYLAGERLSDAA